MERIERMFPDYTEMLVLLGRYYLEGRDTTRALALFERLADRNPRSGEAHYYLGVTRMLRGDNARALKELDRAVQLDPQNYYAYLAAYSLSWEMGDHERALSYLQRWADDHPDDSTSRAALQQLSRQGRAAPWRGQPGGPP